MKTGRLTAVLTTAVMIAGVFSGCGKNTEDSVSDRDITSSENVVADSSSLVEKKPVTEEEWHSAMLEKAMYSYGNTDMVQKVIRKAQSGEKVTIAYLGGSITEGIGADAESCYAKLSCDYFREKYGKGNNVCYCNAGLSGTPSKLGNFRLERDVLSYDPDICFIEFAVNDSVDPEHEGAYESIVRTLLEKNIAPILLFSVTEADYSAQDYMKEIGDAYNLPMISYCDALRYMFENGKMTWKDFSDDDAHPDKNGHKLVAEMIDYYFDTVMDIEPTGEYVMPETEVHSLLAVDAKMVEGDKLKAQSLGSWEEGTDTASFTKGWSHISGENKPVVFEIRARNLYMIYREVKSGSLGTVNVKISADGEQTDEFEVNPISRYGWGNPQVTTLEVQGEVKTYRVEVSMKSGDEDKYFDILGFGYVM